MRTIFFRFNIFYAQMSVNTNLPQ